MITIGLTGSIAMGKSTVASQCALLGAKITNADTLVHELMQPGGAAYPEVSKAFPSAVKTGVIDRKLLGGIVFKDTQKLTVLESILHPLVMEAEEQFVQKQRRLGVRVVVLDIPLLFEVGGDARFDMTLVASSPYLIQHQRVMKRSGMTEEKFASILAKQMPDSEKRARADMVINTGLGKAYSMRQLASLFKLLGECA